MNPNLKKKLFKNSWGDFNQITKYDTEHPNAVWIQFYMHLSPELYPSNHCSYSSINCGSILYVVGKSANGTLYMDS